MLMSGRMTFTSVRGYPPPPARLESIAYTMNAVQVLYFTSSYMYLILPVDLAANKWCFCTPEFAILTILSIQAMPFSGTIEDDIKEQTIPRTGRGMGQETQIPLPDEGSFNEVEPRRDRTQDTERGDKARARIPRLASVDAADGGEPPTRSD
jgi:hypothetical protein